MAYLNDYRAGVQSFSGQPGLNNASQSINQHTCSSGISHEKQILTVNPFVLQKVQEVTCFKNFSYQNSENVEMNDRRFFNANYTEETDRIQFMRESTSNKLQNANSLEIKSNLPPQYSLDNQFPEIRNNSRNDLRTVTMRKESNSMDQSGHHLTMMKGPPLGLNSFQSSKPSDGNFILNASLVRNALNLYLHACIQKPTDMKAIDQQDSHSTINNTYTVNSSSNLSNNFSHDKQPLLVSQEHAQKVYARKSMRRNSIGEHSTSAKSTITTSKINSNYLPQDSHVQNILQTLSSKGCDIDVPDAALSNKHNVTVMPAEFSHGNPHLSVFNDHTSNSYLQQLLVRNSAGVNNNEQGSRPQLKTGNLPPSNEYPPNRFNRPSNTSRYYPKQTQPMSSTSNQESHEIFDEQTVGRINYYKSGFDIRSTPQTLTNVTPALTTNLGLTNESCQLPELFPEKEYSPISEDTTQYLRKPEVLVNKFNSPNSPGKDHFKITKECSLVPSSVIQLCLRNPSKKCSMGESYSPQSAVSTDKNLYTKDHGGRSVNADDIRQSPTHKYNTNNTLFGIKTPPRRPNQAQKSIESLENQLKPIYEAATVPHPYIKDTAIRTVGSNGMEQNIYSENNVENLPLDFRKCINSNVENQSRLSSAENQFIEAKTTEESTAIASETDNILTATENMHSSQDELFLNGFCNYMEEVNLLSTELLTALNSALATNAELDEKIKKLTGIIENNKNNRRCDQVIASTSEVTEKSKGKPRKKLTRKVENDMQNYRRDYDFFNDNDNSSYDESEKDEPPKKKGNYPRPFTLPPEYDAYDTKWTLKHRKAAPGLVELVTGSGVLIDYIELMECLKISNGYKSLARLLLKEIFTESALSSCSFTGAKASAFNTPVRPGLDKHARSVLLEYVKNNGLDKNWGEFDLHTVLVGIRSYLTESRNSNYYSK